MLRFLSLARATVSTELASDCLNFAMIKFWLQLSILVLFAFAGAAMSQDDDPIKVDASIVPLNVGVVNGRGNPVTNLIKENFKVYEDGVLQPISRFEPTVAPFSVVMLLDMSGSTLGFRQTIRMSAFRFIDALSPDDRVAVIEFYDKVNLRNDFTTDRRIIAHSIEASNGRGKTQLYKALEMAITKLAGEDRGGRRRKAIIALTDGVDTSLQNQDRNLLASVQENRIPSLIDPKANETLNRILNRADKLGITVYPLALPTGDPAKLADPTPMQVAMYRAARDRLQILADRTGGTLNAINHLEDMGRLYAAVAADLRALYTIEYQPTNSSKDGKWRAIKIQVDDPALIVKTRQGYFAK